MIESIPNFRDAGGLPSRFGGTIRKGRLLRCGVPHKLSETEVPALLELGIQVIADLRYKTEREHEPSPWPQPYLERIVAYEGTADQTAPHLQLIRSGTLTVESSRQCYDGIFRAVPYDPEYRQIFARILEMVAAGEAPMLVHCSAGKDRTGMVIALIQSALGAAREDIMTNFLLSNEAKGLHEMAETVRALVKQHHGHDYPPEVFRHVIGVEAPYLEAFFDEITRRSGSVDAYLAELGFDERARESALVEWLE